MRLPDAGSGSNVRLDPGVVAGPHSGRAARLVLPFEDKNIAFIRRRPTVKTDRGLTWRGLVEETGERALFMLSNEGQVSGYFSYKGRTFVVNNLGGDIHAMAEIDPAKLPPDHTPGVTSSPAHENPVAEPPVMPMADDTKGALEAKKITIDLMILYTKNAASHYIQNPADLLTLVIEDANESFRMSGLGNITLRLVHIQEIDYDEGDRSHFDHLYQLIDGIGPFAVVKKLRDEKRADIVGLVLDNPVGCGLSPKVGADAEQAYFVAHHACVALSYTVSHEIGHIIGARHDRATDDTNAPLAYAHGFVNGTKWRDIMSYPESCGGCRRIPFWSNPRVIFSGELTGTLGSDNARVILEQAERVSKFR